MNLLDKRIRLSVSSTQVGEQKFEPDKFSPYLNLLPASDQGSGFEPTPIGFDLLTQLVRESTTHETCLNLKHDLCLAGFQESPKMRYSTLSALFMDFFILGNAFVHKKTGLRLPARFYRFNPLTPEDSRIAELLQIQNGKPTGVTYPVEEIIHLKRHCLESEAYGLPQYLANIGWIVLLKSAYHYRQKFYTNGTHGRIVLTNLPNQQQVLEDGTIEDAPAIKQLRELLSGTRQTGAHSSIHLNIEDADLKAAENLISVVELGQKLKEDDFLDTVTRAESAIIVSHGLVPDLVGLVQPQQRQSPNFEKVMSIARETVAQPTREYFSSMLGYTLDFKGPTPI